MNKSLVYVKFPRAGLGNLLLIWAKAKVFAHINGLHLATSGWWSFKPGSWWRNENKKRVYWGYFKKEQSASKFKYYLALLQNKIVYHPEMNTVITVKRNLYLFDKIDSSERFFEPLQSYRSFLKHEIITNLKPSLLKRFNAQSSPAIAVHIRRGDFKISNLVTPLQFFISCIKIIRETVKENIEVKIYTDADKYEIAELLQLPNVKKAADGPDILDILEMSKSKFIILSQSSTFSYWGAFLSEALIIMPKSEWQKQIRYSNAEGEIKIDPDLLADAQFLKEKILYFSEV